MKQYLEREGCWGFGQGPHGLLLSVKVGEVRDLLHLNTNPIVPALEVRQLHTTQSQAAVPVGQDAYLWLVGQL